MSEPRPGIDPGTSILPRWRSTTELSGQQIKVYGTVHLFDKCRVSVLHHVRGGLGSPTPARVPASATWRRRAAAEPLH